MVITAFLIANNNCHTLYTIAKGYIIFLQSFKYRIHRVHLPLYRLNASHGMAIRRFGLRKRTHFAKRFQNTFSVVRRIFFLLYFRQLKQEKNDSIITI